VLKLTSESWETLEPCPKIQIYYNLILYNVLNVEPNPTRLTQLRILLFHPNQFKASFSTPSHEVPTSLKSFLRERSIRGRSVLLDPRWLVEKDDLFIFPKLSLVKFMKSTGISINKMAFFNLRISVEFLSVRKVFLSVKPWSVFFALFFTSKRTT